MKKPFPKWIHPTRLVCFGLATVLIVYVSDQLYASLRFQYAGEWDQLTGFVMWLSGYLLIGGVLLLIGWGNFRGPYTWWQANENGKWMYRSWLLLLFLVIYLFLQNRTDFQLEWVEENLLVTLLAFGFVLGFTRIAVLIRSRNQQARLLQQHATAELQALRAQLNPHFLFNALNTLYSQAVPLADERLANHIQELSGILRFSLQQSQKEWVDIEEEIAFLERYISLQRARLSQPECLEVHISWDESPAVIPPLLLLPFIENLFKYGLRKDAHASIQLDIQEGALHFYSENEIFEEGQKQGTGTGISLVQRRLDIVFPQSYQLTFGAEGKLYKVDLFISLLATIPTAHPSLSTLSS
ncbi:MAG: histidine kinase [Bacteroidota bacterium]